MHALDISSPSVQTRRQFRRHAAKAWQLPFVPMRLRQPAEHARRCALKDGVNPCLRATACRIINRLCHRTRTELADAGQIVVQHPLNQRVVIGELRQNIRACALRILHLHVNRPRTKDVLPHAILELAGQRVHRLNVVSRYRRVIRDVQEAPAHLIVDACVQRRLLPQLIRLQQRTKDALAFPLTSRRCAMHDVNEVSSWDVRVTLTRGELHATQEVALRLRVPQHHRRMRDRVPLNRIPLEQTRKHQAETHERIQNDVLPQCVRAAQGAVKDDCLLNHGLRADVHEGLLFCAWHRRVRPDDLLRKRRSFRD